MSDDRTSRQFKVIGGLSADELLSGFVQDINYSSSTNFWQVDSSSLTFRKNYHDRQSSNITDNDRDNRK